MDKTDLSVRDTELFCTAMLGKHIQIIAPVVPNICESTVERDVPIGDVMRYLMYFRSYGESDYAATPNLRQYPEITRGCKC